MHDLLAYAEQGPLGSGGFCRCRRGAATLDEDSRAAQKGPPSADCVARELPGSYGHGGLGAGDLGFRSASLAFAAGCVPRCTAGVRVGEGELVKMG